MTLVFAVPYYDIIAIDVMFRATEPVGLSLLEHDSRLTIALTTAADNKQNAVFLGVAEARKNCSGNPAERHNLFALCRWRNLPVAFRFLWKHKLAIRAVEHLRVGVAKFGRHARRIMNCGQPIRCE